MRKLRLPAFPKNGELSPERLRRLKWLANRWTPKRGPYRRRGKFIPSYLWAQRKAPPKKTTTEADRRRRRDSTRSKRARADRAAKLAERAGGQS